jgi:predicted O-methyltransferase YrrM
VTELDQQPASPRPADTPGATLGVVSARGLGPVVEARKWLIDRLVHWQNRRGERALRAMPALWDQMMRVSRGNLVTGASYSDYRVLYDQIRRYRPREVLECGTGISTVVLAQALRENEAEGHGRGRLTSMEEDAGWHRNALEHLPDELRDYVDLVHSPKVDGFYKCFRGVQYAEVPDRPYDFVFSDGPERHSPDNSDKLFDLDLIHVVRRSDRPVRAVVDNHYLTFYVLQKVFGPELARYSVTLKLMFVGPVTRDNVRHLKKENFVPDLRLLRPTEFKLRMAIDD